MTNDDGVNSTTIVFSDYPEYQQLRLEAQCSQHQSTNPTWENRFHLSYIDYPLFVGILKVAMGSFRATCTILAAWT